MDMLHSSRSFCSLPGLDAEGKRKWVPVYEWMGGYPPSPQIH